MSSGAKGKGQGSWDERTEALLAHLEALLTAYRGRIAGRDAPAAEPAPAEEREGSAWKR